MKQQYVYGLAALLALIGLSVFAYKWQVLGFPVSEDQEVPVWTIESSIRNRLYTLNGAVKVVPGHGPSTSIDRERLRWRLFRYFDPQV